MTNRIPLLAGYAPAVEPRRFGRCIPLVRAGAWSMFDIALLALAFATGWALAWATS